MRIAISRFLEAEQRRAREEAEAAVFRRHRRRLARQAEALVGIQAPP